MSIIPKPTWLNPAERWVNMAEKYAPVQALPDGKILAPVQKRKDVAAESIIGRMGVVAVLNYDAPANVRHGFHHAVDVKNFCANQTPGQTNQWTRNEMRAAASAHELIPCEGNDFGEGLFAFQPDTNQALWWYQRRREMYADPVINPNGIVRRDYGHHGCTIAYQGGIGPWYDNNGGQISPTNPYFRSAFQSAANARAGIAYFSLSIDGIAYQDLVGCNIKNYAETPDYARSYYQKRYAIQRMGLGMGKVGGLGPGLLLYNDWSKIEGNGNANSMQVHNGHQYFRRIEGANNTGGTVVSDEHAQVDYDWQVGCYLINGFLYGDGVSTFDVPTRFGTDASKMAALNTPGTPGNDNAIGVYWNPDQSGTPAPVSADGFPIEPNRWHDAAYEAAFYYSKFDRTAGQPWAPMAYRFEGSETWIEPPADGASVLEHAAAFDGPNSLAQGARRGRPTVDGRVKNSALDVVAFDASRGKMYREKIFIRKPNGDQFPSMLQGCRPNPHNETV